MTSEKDYEERGKKGPTVYGQGGLEETNSEKPLTEAWQSPTGSTSMYIARKTKADKVITNKEAQALVKKTQQNATEKELDAIQQRSGNLEQNKTKN